MASFLHTDGHVKSSRKPLDTQLNLTLAHIADGERERERERERACGAHFLKCIFKFFNGITGRPSPYIGI